MNKDVLHEELYGTRKENEKLERQLKETREFFVDKCKQNAELIDENEYLRTKNFNCYNEVEEYKKRIDNLKQDYKQKIDDMKSLSDEYDNIYQECIEKHKQVVELKEDLIRSEAMEDYWKIHSSELNEDLEKLKQANTQLKRALEKCILQPFIGG